MCFIFFDDVNTSHFGEKKCYSICYSEKQGVLMRKKIKNSRSSRMKVFCR